MILTAAWSPVVFFFAIQRCVTWGRDSCRDTDCSPCVSRFPLVQFSLFVWQKCMSHEGKMLQVLRCREMAATRGFSWDFSLSVFVSLQRSLCWRDRGSAVASPLCSSNTQQMLDAAGQPALGYQRFIHGVSKRPTGSRLLLPRASMALRWRPEQPGEFRAPGRAVVSVVLPAVGWKTVSRKLLFGLVVVSARTVANYALFLECALWTAEDVLLNNFALFQLGQHSHSTGRAETMSRVT